jgi:hypothetical protein
MKRARLLVGLGVLLLAAGCDVRRDRAPAEDDPARDTLALDTVGVAAPVETEARPAEKDVAVSIEGMEEEMRVVLYEAPPDFPVRFSTYVPVDMAAERWRSPPSDAVAFVAMFGGQRNEAAAVRMIVHREGATEHEVVEILTELARDLGTELNESSDAPRFDWSIREFRNVADPARADAAQGIMAVGQRAGRYFTVAFHYPAEYGDGFAPRVNQILQEWRWEG